MRTFLLFCLIFLASCGGEPSKEQPVAAPPRQAVTIINKTIAEALGEVTNARGSVVFLHIYAAWCGPCVEEFPDVVELANRYRTQGLKVVAISVDEDDGELQRFLEPHALAFPPVRVVSSNEDIVRAVASIGAHFEGGYPYTAIYDRNGRLVSEWTRAKDIAAFEKIIQPLL